MARFYHRDFGDHSADPKAGDHSADPKATIREGEKEVEVRILNFPADRIREAVAAMPDADWSVILENGECCSVKGRELQLVAGREAAMARKRRITASEQGVLAVWRGKPVTIIGSDEETIGYILANKEAEVAILTGDGRRPIVRAKELKVA